MMWNSDLFADWWQQVCVRCGKKAYYHILSDSDNGCCNSFCKDNLQLVEQVAKERGLI